jgi:hypothetical protein
MIPSQKCFDETGPYSKHLQSNKEESMITGTTGPEYDLYTGKPLQPSKEERNDCTSKEPDFVSDNFGMIEPSKKEPESKEDWEERFDKNEDIQAIFHNFNRDLYWSKNLIKSFIRFEKKKSEEQERTKVINEIREIISKSDGIELRQTPLGNGVYISRDDLLNKIK